MYVSWVTLWSLENRFSGNLYMLPSVLKRNTKSLSATGCCCTTGLVLWPSLEGAQTKRKLIYSWQESILSFFFNNAALLSFKNSRWFWIDLAHFKTVPFQLISVFLDVRRRRTGCKRMEWVKPLHSHTSLLFPSLLFSKLEGALVGREKGIFLAGSTIPPVNNYPSCCWSCQLIGLDERTASNIKIKLTRKESIASTQAPLDKREQGILSKTTT